MTKGLRSKWDRRFWQAFRALRQSRPDLPLEWARRNAYRSVTVELGPRPPGTAGLILRALAGFVAGGAQMKWNKVSWKALRGIGAGALAFGAYAALEFLLHAFDTPEELLQIGSPVWLVPILLGIGAGLRNWLKHRKGPEPPK